MKEKILLKNGKEYLLREIEINDAESMILHIESISRESDNLTFGPGEFCPSIKDEKEFINTLINNENCYGLIAEHNGKIIGNLSFLGGRKNRISHTGDFGVSVLKGYWGNGVATTLIIKMFEWAKTSPISKINLRVKDDNTVAIDLYKKLGFENEGKLKHDFKIDGVFYDSILMGKIID